MNFFSGVLPGYRQVGELIGGTSSSSALRIPSRILYSWLFLVSVRLHLLLFEPDYLIQRTQIDFIDDDAGIRVQNIQHRIGHIVGLDVLS